MLERFYTYHYVLGRLRDSSLGDIVDDLATYLHERERGSVRVIVVTARRMVDRVSTEGRRQHKGVIGHRSHGNIDRTRR